MKRFSEYKEEKIFEGLLRDVFVFVKGKATYYFDKAKKWIIQAVSPASIDGYNKGGIRVSTMGEGMPLLKEVRNDMGVEKTSSVEKNNIKSLIKAVSSVEGDVNEAAVDGFGELSPDGTGQYTWKERHIGADSSVRNPLQDISTKFLKSFILSNILKVSSTSKKHSHPVLLFGAPGVGKTSIINTVIKAYNETYPDGKKGLIVIDCANLALDSLALVMPAKDKATDIIKSVAGIELTDEERSMLSKESVTDMTKDWLPCYKPTGDAALDAKADAIANGLVSTDGVTTEGGIILLDELLRVQDPGVFGQLMNLILSRKLGERVVGSKWTFVCVSNRPNDDRAVANALKNAPSAFFNRFAGVYNIEPSLKDWLAWGRGTDEKEAFDFVTKGEIKSGERSWRVDPRFLDLIEKNPKLMSNIEENNISAGELVGATVRSWTTLSEYLWDIADVNGKNDWLDFPVKDLKHVIFGIIGKEYGTAVVESLDDWIRAKKKNGEGGGESVMDADERHALDLISSMESSTNRNELIDTAKSLAALFKKMGINKTNALMSAKIAEWGTETNTQRKLIIKALIKVYPDLEGRYANLA